MDNESCATCKYCQEVKHLLPGVFRCLKGLAYMSTATLQTSGCEKYEAKPEVGK